MVFGIVNPFSWIFNAISSEKTCLISMPFLLTYIDVRTIKFFLPAESWLVNSNFRPASRMQGCTFVSTKYLLDTHFPTFASLSSFLVSQLSTSTMSNILVIYPHLLVSKSFTWVYYLTLVNLVTYCSFLSKHVVHATVLSHTVCNVPLGERFRVKMRLPDWYTDEEVAHYVLQ